MLLQLLDMALKLGAAYTFAFCESVARTVSSPFLLVTLLERALVAAPNGGLVAHGLGGARGGQLLPANTGRVATVGAPPNFRLVGAQIREFMLVLGYAPAFAELGRASVEMLYRATSRKLSHPRFSETDRPEACCFFLNSCYFVTFRYASCFVWLVASIQFSTWTASNCKTRFCIQ